MPSQDATAAIDEVSDAIDAVAQKHNCNVTTKAKAFLVQRGPSYLQSHPRALPLDAQALEDQLEEIFHLLIYYERGLSGKTLDQDAFDRVLPKVACHYIWFC